MTTPAQHQAAERRGLFIADDGVPRCHWCRATPGYQHYHDHEWGFPVTDDRRLFEKICLEGFQAGLSWLTILNKREAFRAGFANFDAEQVARFTATDVERLLGDAGIVRHRGKIESTINNAQRVLEMRAEFGSLAAWRRDRAELREGACITLAHGDDWIALARVNATAVTLLVVNRGDAAEVLVPIDALPFEVTQWASPGGHAWRRNGDLLTVSLQARDAAWVWSP